MTAVPGGRAPLNSSAIENLLFTCTLAKQNEETVTEKQNILRSSLEVIIHQPLLIM